LAQSADNTKINKQDGSQKELTADQQGETKQDREITQEIRRAIVKDNSLSTYAHNVKIITVGGMVTLKGPVRSEKEKRAIEEKAVQIAGNDKIKSEIDIAPK
jgi:osmotically-inducible protein OsmY